MNPRLTDWLRRYADARQDWDDQTADALNDLMTDRVAPARPDAMRYAILDNGSLFDHTDTYLGNAADLTRHDRRLLGLNPDWNPMPRRNPDAATDAAATATLEATRYPAPTEATLAALREALSPRPGWDEASIPATAAPGDVVLRNGRAIGTVGLDRAGNIRVINNSGERRRIALEENRPPQGSMEAHRLAMVDESNQCMDLTGINLNGIDPGVIRPLDTAAMAATINTNVTNAVTTFGESVASVGTAAHAALEAMARVGPAEEVYEGPRLLATIGGQAGSGELYRTHAAQREAAHERAQSQYFLSPAYSTMTSRLRKNSILPQDVDRNAAAVDRFLYRGFGIELNEETLNAVTAMVNVFARQTAVPLVQQVEERNISLRQEREARREAATDAQRARNQVTALEQARDNAPAAAATAAAMEAATRWNETPLTDSVAKRDSFLHLLDTLKQLAG
jgi:hypothetical protein